MTSGSHSPFLLTNIVANRLLIPLLRSRAGRRLGRRIAVVEYLGRRSGQHHQLVTQYVKEGSTVRIEVGRFDRKTWWRNFKTEHPVRLRLAGLDYDRTARVVRERNRVSVLVELDAEAS
jgi:hypothetical protein